MLLQKIASVCARDPNRRALVDGTHSISYGQLKRCSSEIAVRLKAQGIVKGDLIVIYGRRTVELVACIVGVMKSGATYTIVEDDESHPEIGQHLTAMGAQLVLCEPRRRELLHSVRLRTIVIESADTIGEAHVDDGDLPRIDPSDLAYVLFTSGSTGKPKGVAVTHGNIAHYTSAICERLHIEPGLSYVHASTFTADLGNTSLFLSLATGGCLHIIDHDTRKDSAAFRRYLEDNAIQFLKITPSHWNAVFGRVADSSAGRIRLRYLVFGGEVLPISLARRTMQSGVAGVVVNHYGPTETTVGVTVYPIYNAHQLDSLTGETVPIGWPLGSTVLRVCAETGVLLEKDANGELYIGGPSVSAGYVYDTEATRKKFVTFDSPNERYGRFYKSGDQVAVDSSGLVRFLGRVDRQVKVNGYRIELEYVEDVLRSIEGVEDAAVFLFELDGKNRLIAALMVRGGERPLDWPKKIIAAMLPGYMVPSAWFRFVEFPRNSNGKKNLAVLREQILTQLEDRLGPDREQALAASSQPSIYEEMRRIWRTFLRTNQFSDTDSFFDVGGDSLMAIELIAELQINGYQITAHAFLADPTISGLVNAISAAADKTAFTPRRPRTDQSRIFSFAQEFFFRQCLNNPDHYNQAFLFESRAPIDIDSMRKVIAQLIANHPSLRAAYGQDESGRYVRVVDMDGCAFTVSHFLDSEDPIELQNHIERESQRIQASLSLAQGKLFAACLFKFKSRSDHLLLVAHHVAVDLISWRIIISDIVRLYGAIRSGAATSAPRATNTFWDWIDHVNSHNQFLMHASADWLRATFDKTKLQVARVVNPDNLEGSARTLWLGFSSVETRVLLRELTTTMEAPFHLILLATFAHCMARQTGATDIAIDVESHGRIAFDESIDVSRIVGWHTSTFPVFIDTQTGDIGRIIQSVVSIFHGIPHLGTAYGVSKMDSDRRAPMPPSAPACFNYLGEIKVNDDDALPLVPSRHSIGRARNDNNHRGHELKMTVRVIDGHLIIDLSFSKTSEIADMQALVSDIQTELLRMSGLPSSAPRIVLEQGTRTGLLSYVPESLIAKEATSRQPYTSVLLTGATGYVGVHVLREILRQSDAHVYCIVRVRGQRSVEHRMHAIYDWYFPDAPLSTFSRRITVIPGDTSHDRFGLDVRLYDQLCAEVDAVYHFAADTRLFGTEEEFHRNNIRSVELCIDFAKRKRPKDIHYMSTLAVSGVNPGEQNIRFTEDTLDVGQEFQNHYESTKFVAEQLVRNFDIPGCNVFVYRSGNVSGNSATARFQRRAKDNRLIQFLVACAKVGKIPKQLGDPIALSPVDEVAVGIVMISLDPQVRGGVFHVDSVHEIEVEKFFAALSSIGIEFQQSHHASFASLFSSIRGQADPDVALGYFWSTRKPRNITYDSERTHRLLRRFGYSFTKLDEEWLVNFFRLLAVEGIFSVAPAEKQQSVRSVAYPSRERPIAQ